MHFRLHRRVLLDAVARLRVGPCIHVQVLHDAQLSCV